MKTYILSISIIPISFILSVFLHSNITYASPATPVITDIKVIEVTSNLIRLDWEDVEGAVEYKIKWQRNNSHLPDAIVSTSRAKFSNLRPSTRYSFKVIGILPNGREGLRPDNWKNITTYTDNETQIIGNVPNDYKTGAHLTWTGGTLYQLKARLQTLGCTADKIFIYNMEQERSFLYSQYDLSHNFNQEFHENYPNDYIPPTSIYIPSCYDMCTFMYTDNVIEDIEIENEYVAQNIKDFIKCETPESATSRRSNSSDFEGAQCNQDWDPRAIEHVFPIMPVMKDLCIFRIVDTQSKLSRGRYMDMSPVDSNIWISFFKPFITIYNSHDEESFFVELHEICHSQQDWYVSQFMSPYEIYTEDKTGLWNNTPAGQAFIDMAQFEIILGGEQSSILGFEQPRWKLDPDSLYYNVYPNLEKNNPREVAAQLCAIKLYLDITGEEEVISRDNRYSLETIQHANQWLEDYVFVLE